MVRLLDYLLVQKCLKTTDFSKLIHINLRMYEVVSMHFYLHKWAGLTAENTFYSTQNLAVSDTIGFKKIKDGVFEQFERKKCTNVVNFATNVT